MCIISDFVEYSVNLATVLGCAAQWSLMGHGSKEMVYEVYGQYVEDLEKDKDKILGFFGEDFIGSSR